MTQREFSYTLLGNKINLESKKDMKERLGGDYSSPDVADALALTFAYPVSKRGYDDDEHEETARGRSEATGY